MNEQERDYGDPRYDRFRDMPFSKIYDKDGNDVTRERMLPKVLMECQVCGITIKIIIEDLELGVADMRCKICQKETDIAVVESEPSAKFNDKGGGRP